MIHWDCRVMKDLTEKIFRLFLCQVPLHRLITRHQLYERQGKHPFYVGKEEATLSKPMEPFVTAIKHNLYILIDGVSDFFNNERASDLSPPSMISSQRVCKLAWLNLARRSRFFAVKAGTVLSSMETTSGSAPPTWPKWCLFTRGFEKYFTIKRKNII